MPATTVMQGGVLPLEKIADLPGVIKKLKPASRPPSESSAFAESLRLDSPLFLSGILRNSNRIRYTIASSGSTTVITHPATSRNVATIRWPKSFMGEGTLVETQELTLRLKKWLSSSSMGPITTHQFKKYGQTPGIKWTEKHGEWEATDPEKQVLAVLVSRKSAIGTRLELTPAGLAHADALVLTALLTVTGEYDWRLYSFIRNDLAATPETTTESTDEQSGSGTGQPDVTPPTYRQAPFTRPLGPLLRASSNTAADDSASSNSTTIINGIPPTLPPLSLTLSSRELLCSTFSDGTRTRVSIVTQGPFTNVVLHSPHSGAMEHGATTSSVSRIQTSKMASVEWASPSKEPARVMIRGRHEKLADVVLKGSIFGSRKEKHFGLLGFLPSMTWTEVSRTSTASIYNDPNTSIRYTCRSCPDNRPLAVLTHYTKRKGTQLELTPEGHEMIVEVVLTALITLCGPNDWKSISGEGIPIEEMRGATAEGSLVVGEEMVSDLDGWAGPPELMRLRSVTESHLGQVG